jgi:hypothetical protein
MLPDFGKSINGWDISNLHATKTSAAVDGSPEKRALHEPNALGMTDLL